MILKSRRRHADASFWVKGLKPTGVAAGDGCMRACVTVYEGFDDHVVFEVVDSEIFQYLNGEHEYMS